MIRQGSFGVLKNISKMGMRIPFALLLLVSVSLTIFSPSHAEAAVGSLTQYETPQTGAIIGGNVTFGPDNNLWFTSYGPATNTAVRKLTTSGDFMAYGNLTINSRYPGVISKGSDGNLWYAEQYTANGFLYYRIVSVTTGGVVLGTYSMPSNASATSMTLGPDGNVWFTESSGSKVGKITISGIITEYVVPGGYDLKSITTGPDGNLWFTSSRAGVAQANAIGKITTDGVSTLYPVSERYSLPSGITTGPDGNLWFTMLGVSKVAKVTTDGVMTYFTIPSIGTPLTESSITTGSDGSLWFTRNNYIMRMTVSGEVTQYSVPSNTRSIVTGPEGTVWFRLGSSVIGEMTTELSSQTISFTSSTPSNVTVDSPGYTPAASATSGLPVVITVDSSSSSVCSMQNGVVKFQDAGTCTLNANQGGDADYNPALQVQQSFTVNPVDADTSIALSCPPSVSVGSIVTCTITIANDGPAAAENASLAAIFSDAFTNTLISSGGTISGKNITWSIPALDSGTSTTLTFTATASMAGRLRINAALLQTSPDPNKSDNMVTAAILAS